jgi:hypothetical protein
MTFTEAALSFYAAGYPVIPIVPRTKQTAVQWDKWLRDQSSDTIAAYWKRHPNYELGCIVGDELIVFDADSSVSIAALYAIETRFGITPSMVVKTRKGEHHYFRRARGTFAKSDSHSTIAHPERIDIKTGRAMVVLPPSTGKTLATGTPEGGVVKTSGLAEVSQDFIDAVFQHNGRMPPCCSVLVPQSAAVPADANYPLLRAILRCLDPSCGYEDWLHTGMALHHETAGSDDGLALFDSWSSAGETYKGASDTASKWRSFRSDQEGGYTIRSLFWMAGNAGYSPTEIYAETEPFEIVEDEDGAA